jgi:hypothetical protein
MTMPDDYQLVTDQDYDPDIKLGVSQDEWLDKDTRSLGISLPPELVSLMTFNVTQFGSSGGQASGVQGSTTNGIVPILSRRLTRHRARIWIVSVTAATAIVLGRTQAEVQNGVAGNLLQGAGLYIPAAMVPFGGGGGLPWENQRECFATAIGGTATIIVLDESYAQERSIDVRDIQIGAR